MSGRIVNIRPAPSTPPESPRGRMLTFSPRISPHSSPPTGVGFVRSPARRVPTPDRQQPDSPHIDQTRRPPQQSDSPRIDQTRRPPQQPDSPRIDQTRRPPQHDPLFDDISELITTIETKRTSPAKRDVQQAKPQPAQIPPQAKPQPAPQAKQAKQAVSRVAARMMAEAASTVRQPTTSSPPVATMPPLVNAPAMTALVATAPPSVAATPSVDESPAPVNYERERIVELLDGYFPISRDQWADLHPGAAIRYFKKPTHAGMTKEETFVKGGYIREITPDSFYIGQGAAGTRIYKVKTKNIQEIWKLSGQNVAIELKILHDMVARLEARVIELETGKK